MLKRIRQELKEGKNFLQFGVLKALGQGLGMIAPLVIAKYLEPDLFGSYSLAKMVVFFFTSFLVASSQAPFIVFGNQERVKSGRINKTFSVQCIFVAFSLIAFLLITTFCHKAVMAFAGISFVDLFFVLLAFIGLVLQTFLSNLFMALGQRIKSSLAELTFGSLIMTIVLVLCFANKITLARVFLVYFVSGLLVVLLLAKTIDFKLLLPFDFDKQHFKDMLIFTKWVIFGSIALYFINWGDNLVLRIFRPMSDIGKYNLGYQIFKGITTLSYVINVYYLPFISQHIEDSVKIRNYLSKKRPKIFLLGIIIIAAFFVVFPHILKFFYGTVYQDSIGVLKILLIASVLLLYTVFYIPILNSLRQYKFLQTLNIAQVILNLLLDLALVPVMGMLGAAVATTFSYFCMAITTEVYFRVKLKKLLKL